MSGLLDSKNGSSSMRFSLMMGTIGVFILMVAVATYIIIKGFQTGASLEGEWSQMGFFALGLATMLTGMGWTKVQQKKLELNGASNETKTE